MRPPDVAMDQSAGRCELAGVVPVGDRVMGHQDRRHLALVPDRMPGKDQVRLGNSGTTPSRIK